MALSSIWVKPSSFEPSHWRYARDQRKPGSHVITPLRIFVATAVVALIVTLAAVAWWDATRPVIVVVHDDPNATIVVDISGAVASPGSISLPVGSRLEQAISAAGGLSPDADIAKIYLAERLGDGDHVIVPAIGKPTLAVTRPASPMPTVSGVDVIDINTASQAELTSLPGVGDVIAERIVAYRTVHGPFTSIDQLDNVEGIGPALIEQLRPLVTVGDQ